MDEIKKLIRLISDNELYTAKEELNKITKQKLDDYKKDISKKADIFGKKG